MRTIPISHLWKPKQQNEPKHIPRVPSITPKQPTLNLHPLHPSTKQYGPNPLRGTRNPMSKTSTPRNQATNHQDENHPTRLLERGGGVSYEGRRHYFMLWKRAKEGERGYSSFIRVPIVSTKCAGGRLRTRAGKVMQTQ